jgi:hypothetical protein
MGTDYGFHRHHAAKLIQDALGIESDDIAARCLQAGA